VTLHIGILAHSAEGATLCYRTAWLEGIARMGPHDHPEITLTGVAMHEAMPAWESGDHEAVRALFLADSARLAAAGADFFVLPDNTAHIALEAPGEDFPIPCHHIGEVVADSVAGWLADKRHQAMIDDLLDAGVKVERTVRPAEQPWKGTTFVFTGELEAMPREVEMRFLLFRKRRDPELPQHLLQNRPVDDVDLFERRLAAQNAVHGGPVARAPGLREFHRVDPQSLRLRQPAHFTRNRPVPVHDGAEDIEGEQFDLANAWIRH
jgi:hypothetical protein